MRRTLRKRKVVLDSLSHSGMGIGGHNDKLKSILPNAENLSVIDSENWYQSNGYIQLIVDIPAEDATREWIKIKTNKDDLNISRLIQNRFSELKFQKKLCQLIIYSRMYNQGGFLYYGINHTIPQTPIILEQKLPTDLTSIDFINVLSPNDATILDLSRNALSKDFSISKIRLGGIDLHASRYDWLIRSFIQNKGTGISAIQTILDAAKAQGIALWSVTTLLSELSIKIFSSPLVDNSDPEKILELLALIRRSISTQGAFAAGENEKLERLNVNLPGLKDIFDFLIDTLAGLSQIPKSRLLGQAQGTITGGQYDLVSYYDSIAKFQELELRPIIEKVIYLIINERSGEIYRLLNQQIDSLDWEFEFNPLWKLSENEQAEVNLKNAQTDKIYLENAVVTPNEIRNKRFKELEDFTRVATEKLEIPPNID